MFALEVDDQPRTHLAEGGQCGDHFVGQRFGDEHHRVGALDGRVEDVLDPTVGVGIDGGRRSRIGTAGERMGMNTGRSEPSEHVDWIECSQVAESPHSEPGEQFDQIGINLTECVEPTDRQRRTECCRCACVDHDRRPTCDCQASGDSRGEPTVSDPDADTDRRAHAVDGQLDNALGEYRLTTEVTRGTSGGHGEPSRLDHVEAWRQVGDGPQRRLEDARIALGVVIDQLELWAALLG